MLPNRQTRPDVRQAYTDWQEPQSTFNPTQLIFIDETSTATHMAPCTCS